MGLYDALDMLDDSNGNKRFFCFSYFIEKDDYEHCLNS